MPDASAPARKPYEPPRLTPLTFTAVSKHLTAEVGSAGAVQDGCSVQRHVDLWARGQVIHPMDADGISDYILVGVVS